MSKLLLTSYFSSSTHSSHSSSSITQKVERDVCNVDEKGFKAAREKNSGTEQPNDADADDFDRLLQHLTAWIHLG